MSALRRLVLLLTCAAAAMAGDVEPVRYWSGDQPIDALLALDEVQIEGDASTVTKAADQAGIQERTEAKARQAGSRRLHLRWDAGDRAVLGERLRRIRSQGGVTGVAAVLYPTGGAAAADRRQFLTADLSVCVEPGTGIADVAALRGLRVVAAYPWCPGAWHLEAEGGPLAALDAANALRGVPGVRWATPLVERQASKRGTPADPLFASQWHLQNTGPGQVSGGVAGNDINVVPVWDFSGGGSHLGAGINVAVVDDGLELTHEDLSANVRTDIDINFNGAPGNAGDPSPGSADSHGTFCAGLIAARDSNALGGVGVAPRARLVGVRLIAAAVSDATEAQAMLHQVGSSVLTVDQVQVSSNSWGPSDDGTTLGSPGPLMTAALQTGATTGRGGKGIVYVWAGGNGGAGDNVAYDAYASNRNVLAVGALAPDGTQASYSESGCALLVCAPGGDFSGRGMVSADRMGGNGFVTTGNYSSAANNLAGTSFATPLVSGVVALLLEANPALTARDVYHVLVRSAAKNDPGDGGWSTNQAGRHFNHRYGFGRVDAAQAMTISAPGTWIPAPAAATPLTATASAGLPAAIADSPAAGISRTVSVSAPSGFRAERVELTVSVTHTARGDLHFTLTAPSGMVTDIPSRIGDTADNYTGWAFTSVAHWGENPSGTWTLGVTDEAAVDTGSLTAWSLRIHGYLPHSTPTIASVSPASIGVGAGNTTITVNGTGFLAGVSTVQWNGGALNTTVVSGTQATAVVPSASLLTTGSNTVTVSNADFDGGAAHVSTGSPVAVVPPSVTALGSTPSTAAYPTSGVTVPVTVTFSGPVTVNPTGGTPTLTLNTTPSRAATWVSGSGTSVLTFEYTIVAGDRSDHLDESATGALATNGGTIRSSVDAGAAAVLTLPAPGAAGSLGANTGLVIGGDLPVVTSVSSTSADGTYGIGAQLPITVTFSQNVLVTGTPSITLATGGAGATAPLVGGNGTATLSFLYTVANGHSSADLDVRPWPGNLISLNGGTITTLVGGVPAVLALPQPGGGGSLGANRNLVIQGVSAPVGGSSGSGGGGCGLGAQGGVAGLVVLACLLRLRRRRRG